MSSPFSLEYFDPPQELSRHILTLFRFAIDEGGDREDRHPGGLGQLVLLPRGEGAMQFGERTDEAPPGAYLFCGFSAAAPFHVTVPWHAIGASLSPLGWAALTGEPASKHLDSFPPASRLLGEGIAQFSDDLIARYNRGALTGRQACDELASWIGDHLKPVEPAHEALIEVTIGWLGSSLNPPLDELFAALPYSRRQSERLVERFFGLPPAALARKFRALRASALLSTHDLSDAAQAEIADAFVDQSHMIREIRKFCGYTPSRLGGPGDPIFHTMIRLKNLDRLKHFRKIV